MRSMLLGVAETGLELSPQATEGLFLSCEFCNPSASRCSAPPFTQGRRKVVVVAFATAVQICKCQTFSEGFQPCQYHALIGLCKPPALPVVMTAFIYRIFLYVSITYSPKAAQVAPLLSPVTASAFSLCVHISIAHESLSALPLMPM